MTGDRRIVPDHLETGEGKPVVFIPGLEGAKEFWRPQWEGLADAYRVVATSLPVWRPRLASAVSDYAGCVIALLDELGLERAVIVGESFGGAVTLEMALGRPERVAGIILCNTMDRPGRFGFGLNAFTLATLAHQFAFLPFLSMRRRRSLLRWVGRHRGFVMDPSPGNDDLIEYLVAYGTACGPAAYLDRAVAGAKARFTARLREISVPALVLRGEEDRLVVAEAAVQLAGRIPRAEIALVEGGGHCCTHTVSAASNRAMREWLARIGY